RSAASLSLGLGRFLLGRVLLLALFTLVGLHGRARIAVLRRLFPAAAAPVVGRVEARSLEVDRYRMQHHLERTLAAHRAHLRSRRVDRLEEFEQVTFRTAILVRWH